MHRAVALGLLAASVLFAGAPPARADLKDFQVVKDETPAKGVRYREYRRAEGPTELFVVTADLKDPAITLVTTLAKGHVMGLEGVSRQVPRAAIEGKSVKPIAAVNGDFFLPSGDLVGVYVHAGELISSPRIPWPRQAFSLSDREIPSIDLFSFRGAAQVNGTTLKVEAVNEDFLPPMKERKDPPEHDAIEMVLYTPLYGDKTAARDDVAEAVVELEGGRASRLGAPAKGRVREIVSGRGGTPIPAGGAVIAGHGKARAVVASLAAGQPVTLSGDLPEAGGQKPAEVVGGGPRILRGGKVSIEGDSPSFTNVKHPRTAVGCDAQGKLTLVVVDGRQKEWSMGMALPELGNLMLELGCRDALNLDGGGSSTMWVTGEIRNKPSDGRERPVGNALVVVEVR